MSKKNFLLDLYVLGKTEDFVLPNGELKAVWVQKLNSNENEKALRLANAARSREALKYRDKDSSAYLDARNEASMFDVDTAISFVLAPEIQNAVQLAEAEVEALEEWSKDNYLQGLRDAWRETLEEVWLSREDENADETKVAEATRAFEELQRFIDQVDEKSGPAIEDLRQEFLAIDREEVIDRVTERVFAMSADLAWMDAYHKAQLFLAVRDAESRELLFDKLEEVYLLQDEVLAKLLTAYDAVSVEVMEGKDSQQTPTS